MVGSNYFFDGFTNEIEDIIPQLAYNELFNVFRTLEAWLSYIHNEFDAGFHL